MNKQECISCICRFPVIYKEKETLTPLQIYSKSKYSTYYSEINDSEIQTYIDENLDLVNDWLSFTEDKRWTPAWGLQKNDKDFLVFHVQKDGGVDSRQIFKLPAPACAHMVRMEMEDFRKRNNT